MEAELLDVLSILYSTINAPWLNEEAHDRLALAFGAAGVTQYSESNHSFNLQISSSVYKRYEAEFAEYNKRYAHYEEQGISRLFTSQKFDWLSEETGWPEEDNVIEREDFRFIREKTGLGRTVGVNLSDDVGWKHAFIIHFPEVVKVLPNFLDERIRLFAPHIGKTADLNSFLHGLYHKYQAVLSVLNAMSVGVCVLEERGHIVVSNTKAQQAFRMKDGILVKQGRLHFKSSDQSSIFRMSTQKMAATAKGLGNSTSASFFISRPSGKSPYYIEQSPIRDGCYEIEKNLGGCIVYIIDTDKPPQIDINAFSKMIDLTTSETHIASMVCKGLKDRDIADLRGVSVETVRKQIKFILAKAQVNSRIEFLIKAVSIRAPIV